MRSVISKGLVKQAGIWSSAVRPAINVIGGFGAAVARGVLPAGQGAKFGEKVFGWGVKGAVGLGAYKGGMALYNRAKNPEFERSGQNYTTMLRNNILAGKIGPDELNPQDLVGVRRLGMK